VVDAFDVVVFLQQISFRSMLPEKEIWSIAQSFARVSFSLLLAKPSGMFSAFAPGARLC
jgi:hypothetical protein